MTCQICNPFPMGTKGLSSLERGPLFLTIPRLAVGHSVLYQGGASAKRLWELSVALVRRYMSKECLIAAIVSSVITATGTDSIRPAYFFLTLLQTLPSRTASRYSYPSHVSL